MELLSDISSRAFQSLKSQVDEIVVEGLRRKGYEFNGNRKDTIQFIQRYATVEESKDRRERKYFVKGIPFLFYVESNLPEVSRWDTGVIQMNVGRYTYL